MTEDNLNGTFEVDNSMFDNKLFDELFAPILSNTSFDITYTKSVQVRKHRKKRINKKWAKRYGFRPVQETIKDLKLKSIDGEVYEFISEVL